MVLQCDAETVHNQGAEVTDMGQNKFGDERGAKRLRILSRHTSAEDAPLKQSSAAPEPHPLENGDGLSKAELAAAKATGHGQPSAIGCAKTTMHWRSWLQTTAMHRPRWPR